MSFLTSWRHVDVIFLPNVDANILERSWTEHFLIEKCSYFGVKLIKQYIFKSKCNCRRKSMQEKESVMVVWCELTIPSLKITVRHHSASLEMPNSNPHDGIFNPHLTPMKDSYILTCGQSGIRTCRDTLVRDLYEPRHVKTCFCHMRTTKVLIRLLFTA